MEVLQCDGTARSVLWPYHCFFYSQRHVKLLKFLLNRILTRFTAIYISAIILLLVDKLDPTTQAAVNALNDLIGAALFITASTTSLTASLIAYRIYSLSGKDPLNRARKTFGKVIGRSHPVRRGIRDYIAVVRHRDGRPETATNVWILIATDDYLFYIFPIVAVRRSYEHLGLCRRVLIVFDFVGRGVDINGRPCRPDIG